MRVEIADVLPLTQVVWKNKDLKPGKQLDRLWNENSPMKYLTLIFASKNLEKLSRTTKSPVESVCNRRS